MGNVKQNGSGLTRIKNAFYCSVNGFRQAFKYEQAFQQELVLCFVLCPIGVFIAIDFSHFLTLLISLLFLLFAEIVNSALEALADRISTDHHELIGRAKDMGSSAVFIAIVVVFLVWGRAIYMFMIS